MYGALGLGDTTDADYPKRIACLSLQNVVKVCVGCCGIGCCLDWSN